MEYDMHEDDLGSPRRNGRERSRSGSRSRRRRTYSRSRSPDGRKRYSDSARRRSRSRSRGRGRSGRSGSKSPMSGRRRHAGSRENPPANKCLGIFGLSLRTTERDLRDVFGRYGPIDECTVVIDAQSGRSRGFAFMYFEQVEDAKAAKDSCNGLEIDGRRIRVDFSITKRAHTPTPGVYMGKPSDRKYGGGGGGGREGGGGRDRRRRDDNRGYRRTPSPPRYRARRHSRSRSFSPRKYY